MSGAGNVAENLPVLVAVRDLRAGGDDKQKGKKTVPEFSAQMLMLGDFAASIAGSSDRRVAVRAKAEPVADFQSRLSQSVLVAGKIVISDIDNASDVGVPPIGRDPQDAEALELLPDFNGNAEAGEALSPSAIPEQRGLFGRPLQVDDHDTAMRSARDTGAGPRRSVISASVPAGERAVADNESVAAADSLTSARDAHQGRGEGSGESRGFVPRPHDAGVFRNRNETRVGNAAVRITRQETHFVPVHANSPVIQIAETLAARYGVAAESRAAPRLAGLAPARPDAGNVIRVLQIQLEPAELGTVSVRMTLEGNTLELQIDAQRAVTAELIRNDQRALMGLLQSAGYEIEGVIVQIAEPDRSLAQGSSPAQQAPQSAPHSPSQSQAGSSQPDGRAPDNAQSNAHDRRERMGTTEHPDEVANRNARSSRAAGIYV